MSKQDYFSARRVTAWPEAKDGRAGYGVDMWDGNQIWVPEDIFQAEYRPVDGFSFSQALAALKSGQRVKRARWPASSFLFLVPATATTSAYLGISFPDGHHVAWGAQQVDLMTDDWSIVPDAPIAAAVAQPAEDAAAA